MYSGVRCITVFCRIGFWLCASDMAALLPAEAMAALAVAGFCFLGAFKASVNCANRASCATSASGFLTSLGGSSGALALHLCEYLYACKDMLLPQPSQVTLSFNLLVARFNGGGSGMTSTSSGNSALCASPPCGSSGMVSGIISSTSSILFII